MMLSVFYRAEEDFTFVPVCALRGTYSCAASVLMFFTQHPPCNSNTLTFLFSWLSIMNLF